MSYQYFLDPSLFIWDEDNYESLKNQYYDVAYFLMEAIPTLEKFPIFITGDIVWALINRFPLHRVAAYDELRDLQNALYAFLARLLEQPTVDSPFNNDATHIPSMLCIGIDGGLDASISKCFHAVLNTDDNTIFVTHFNLWDKSCTHLTVTAGEKNAVLDVVANQVTLLESSELFGRIFEQIRKHMRGGWGSLLEISDDRASELLSTAIHTSEFSETLVNHYLDDGGEVVYVVFHNHGRNFYHAYPDPEAPHKFSPRLFESLPPPT